MKKIIILLLIYTSSVFGFEFTWLGTTNIVLKDSNSTLMFDPFMTHPNILKSIIGMDMDSDKQTVNKWLKKIQLETVDSIFISHAHYDHILDLGTVQKKYNSKVYGSLSAVNFALGQGVSEKQVTKLSHMEKLITPGSEILPIKVAHSDHLFGITFMVGEIDAPLSLPTSMWKMKDGENFIYHVKLGNKKVLFHPAGKKSPYFDKYEQLSADILFLGVSKRGSTKLHIKSIIEKVKPKVIIPLHFDNFFMELNSSPEHLPGINLEEWKETVSKRFPKMKIIIPEVARWYSLPE